MKKVVCLFCGVMLGMFLLFAAYCVFAGETCQAPLFKAGDSWTYQSMPTTVGAGDSKVLVHRYAEVIKVDGDSFVTSEKVLDPQASSTLCGSGTGVLEMVVKRDKNTNPLEFTDASGKAIRDCEEQKQYKWTEFPLHVGKKWNFTTQMTTTHGGNMRPHLDMYSNDMEVVGIEEVDLPVGKLKAFKIKHFQRALSCSERPSAKQSWFGTAYTWYAPEAKRAVKRTDFNNTVAWELKSYKVQ